MLEKTDLQSGLADLRFWCRPLYTGFCRSSLVFWQIRETLYQFNSSLAKKGLKKLDQTRPWNTIHQPLAYTPQAPIASPKFHPWLESSELSPQEIPFSLLPLSAHHLSLIPYLVPTVKKKGVSVIKCYNTRNDLISMSFFISLSHSTNLLWIYMLTSCALGISFFIVGLIATSLLWNIALLCNLRDCEVLAHNLAYL